MSEFSESLPLWLPGTVAMLFLIAFSAFFSSSETAFFFLTRNQIRRFSSGRRRQQVVARLLQDPDRLLTAVLFWNLLINLGYFSIGVVVMNRLATADYSIVAATLGVLNLLGMIVIGEVIPKSTAVVFRERWAELAGYPMSLAVGILDPLIPLLNRVALVLRRAFWPNVQQEAHLQPDDLEQAIDASAAMSSELLEIEQQVLHNILDMNEVTVEEVMRPRNRMTTALPSETLNTAELPTVDVMDHVLLRESGSEMCTRAVSLSAITDQADVPFEELAEDVIFVPWCSSIAYVLSEFRNQYRSVAVVVHEFGEMVGVVTYENLLEFVFTELPSRTRRVLRREPVMEISRNRYHADGLVTLRYLYRILRVTFDADDDNQRTLAGLFHDELARIPVVGDKLEVEGWILTAIDVTPQGQVRALIEPADFSAPSTGGAK